jgi:hypothetical protein
MRIPRFHATAKVMLSVVWVALEYRLEISGIFTGVRGRNWKLPSVYVNKKILVLLKFPSTTSCAVSKFLRKPPQIA